MKLHCLGGFGEQGRSALYVEGTSNFLIDYGVKKVDFGNRLGEVPLDNFQKLDFVLLTHAHQDHSAMLPLLVEKGFLVPVYCTDPTKELTLKMCENWWESYKSRNLESPYHRKSIEQLEKIMVTVPYYQTFMPSKSTKVTFYPSGHMVGSAILYIEDEMTIAHFGDTNFSDLFNPEPYLEFEAKVGIINGSYGDSILVSEQLRKQFLTLIESNKGTVLIPCAALGRGQEVCFMLSEHAKLSKPVYVAEAILSNTAAMLKFADYLKAEAPDLLKKVLQWMKPRVLKEANLRDMISENAVLVGPDAMLSSGIAAKVFELVKDNNANLILLNGYQAPGTLGRKLLDRELQVEAKTVYSELKVHTDLEDNKRIIQKTLSKAKLVLIHHGEEPKSTRLALALREIFTGLDIRAPHTADEIII